MTAPASNLAARLQRGLIIALIISLMLTAVMTAVLVLSGNSSQTLARCCATPAIAALCLGLLVAFTAVLRRERRLILRLAMMLGAAISPLASVLILVLILGVGDSGHEDLLVRAGTTAFGCAVALAYTGALALVRTPSWLVRGMAIGTGISVWLAFGLLTLMLFVERLTNNFDNLILFGIVLGILVLLVITGTIAVPVAVVSKAGKNRPAAESIDPRVQVHFGCPKCGARQTHRPGFVKCDACGTGMFIEVEEPRCECGYLLYRLTTDTCPECGRPVTSTMAARDST